MAQNRLRLVTALAVLALAACGPVLAPGGPPTPSPGTVLVYGLAIAWPTCPVQTPGEICSRPIPLKSLQFRRLPGSALAATTSTDAAGHYEVRLEAGTYAVAAPGVGMGRSIVLQVPRTGGGELKRDLIFDTGIR